MDGEGLRVAGDVELEEAKPTVEYFPVSTLEDLMSREEDCSCVLFSEPSGVCVCLLLKMMHQGWGFSSVA